MRVAVLTDLPTPEPEADGRRIIDCPVCSSVAVVDPVLFHAQSLAWREGEGATVAAALEILPELEGLPGEGRALGLVRCPGCGALFAVVTASAESEDATVLRVLHVAVTA